MWNNPNQLNDKINPKIKLKFWIKIRKFLSKKIPILMSKIFHHCNFKSIPENIKLNRFRLIKSTMQIKSSDSLA